MHNQERIIYASLELVGPVEAAGWVPAYPAARDLYRYYMKIKLSHITSKAASEIR